MPSRPGPVAFMSYVREDDDYENGRLTKLRERIEGEVRMQTGRPFPIFQDRNDIEWGNNWKERIEDGLDAISFLIPIITPSFFQSRACRDEFERFRSREKAMDRTDLILPLYYLDSDEFNEEAAREHDTMAQVLLSRQYVDWRPLRFRPVTSAQAGQMLVRMAKQIKAALPGAPARPPSRRSTALSVSEPAPSTIDDSGSPSPQQEPPTYVVDERRQGDFSTLTEAVAAVPVGARILVRPGFYGGGIVMDKPLEIVGDGPRDEIFILASESSVVVFKTTMGRLANLTIRQVGEGKWQGVYITQGLLLMEDCDISSQSQNGVVIRGSADPVVRRNRIHDGKGAGVYVFENGQGTFEDNDITANAAPGITVAGEAAPIFRRNRIHDGKDAGVYVLEDGRGVFEDNDIAANGNAGISVQGNADPVVRRNQIRDGRTAGVFVFDGGRGTFEDNDIATNAFTGIEVRGGADPIVRRNRIHDADFAGVYVHDGGRGTFEDNHLWGNWGNATMDPWNIRPDAGEVIRRGNIKAAPEGTAST